MFFKPKPLLSEDDELWQYETFHWLLQHFPNPGAGLGHALVLPTRECFPDLGETDDDRVVALFDHVRRLAGMQDWPCVLQVQEEDPETLVAPTVFVQGAPQSPAGTFSFDGEGRAIISFNPDIVDDATALVATFAHEFSHYLTCKSEVPPPGGWENWEFATDLTAVHLGFGIFMANSAFAFQQFQGDGAQGWSARRSGYLSETELVHALATHVLVHGLDTQAPLRHLKDSGKSEYKRVVKYLRGSERILGLQAVALAGRAGMASDSAS